STFVFWQCRDRDGPSGQDNTHVRHFDVAPETLPPSPHFRNALELATVTFSSRAESASNRKARGLRHRCIGSCGRARKNHPSSWGIEFLLTPRNGRPNIF